MWASCSNLGTVDWQNISHACKIVHFFHLICGCKLFSLVVLGMTIFAAFLLSIQRSCRTVLCEKFLNTLLAPKSSWDHSDATLGACTPVRASSLHNNDPLCMDVRLWRMRMRPRRPQMDSVALQPSTRKVCKYECLCDIA
jgi:hypothetical protein